MNRWLRALYRVYVICVFAPLLGLSTIFFGTLAALLVTVLSPSTVSFLCGRSWARLNSALTPMWVRVTGRRNVSPGQSYVVVSNHLSHYDIFVLYGWLGIDFRWVMKQELRKTPFIGIACEQLGHIFIDRNHREAALASIDRAKSRIVDGTSVLFFPEGTRSRDGNLQPFKKGAFMLALDIGLPILPVTISGTREILPPCTSRLFPGRAGLRIHEPIDTSRFSAGTLSDLMAVARERILSA